jgi:hypothetical protein
MTAQHLGPPSACSAKVKAGFANRIHAILMDSLFAVTLGEDVEGLDRRRKYNGKVDVAARDMKFESVRDERNADQHQKCQCQHLGGRMLGHESCSWARRHIHDEASDDNSRDHDREILRHANRSDN